MAIMNGPAAVAGQGDVILDVEHISRSFGGVKAVQDFSMQVRQRHVVGLIGPNGAGKTTVFNLLSGIIRADQGHVRLCGQEITNRNSHEIARLGMGRTFQNLRLFAGLSVRDNVKTACCHDAEYDTAERAAGSAAYAEVRASARRQSDELARVGGHRPHG